MEELNMMESIERYIHGEMLPEERVFFEELRKNNPGIDQMVVEHTVFLHQMEKYGGRKNLKSTLEDVHNELFESGEIKQSKETRVVRLWLKYRKVIAVAASIAGVTALGITGTVNYFSPKPNNKSLDYLSRKISILEQKQNSLNDKLNETPPKQPAEGGTGFLIDTKGYIVTNAHVVNNASVITVQNDKGKEFRTKLVYINPASDLAFLKIMDSDYKAPSGIPYGISKGNIELGEAIFTLGYPRDEIVYGEGYLSAKTGFRGDTLACQISVAANPGNSGGPVLDKNGEVIGILSNRQTQAQGTVFAIRSKNIFLSLDEMKSDTTKADTTDTGIRLPQGSSVKNLDRIQQIKKIQEFIYLVKSY
jgi:S1-C subfamily serine protease